MSDERKRACRIAAEVVRALDGIQKAPHGKRDGIELNTRLYEIKDTPFNELWIWDADINGPWLLSRMQKVVDNDAMPDTGKVIYPGTFGKCKKPVDVFEEVLKACQLYTWYRELALADREGIMK
jgi:hypothetical protein